MHRRLAAFSVTFVLGISLFVSLLLPAGSARAHAGDASGFASITVQDASVTYRYTPAPSSKQDSGALPQLIGEKFVVVADDARCVATATDALTVKFSCPAVPANLRLRDDLSDVLGPSHHVIALITWNGGSQSFSFSSQTRETNIKLVAAAPVVARGAGSFFLLGVEHIATGYDHLLFLLVLILCGGSLLQLLKIITAFTLAHSITLGVAALNIVTLPSTLVESVIALSIAYVAFENLFPRYAISRRWTISFLFGLMHGFGFSSVLKEIGLPQGSLLPALLNFNLGVEAGQLIAVALVVPLLVWLKKTRWHAPTVTGISALVLTVGLGLFFERIVWGA